MKEEKMTPVIGIPRALLYYRYGTLWQVFFQKLGLRVLVSGPTSRETLESGARLAPDESCLSLKIFLGHVRELVGTCDYIFVPRIAGFGRRRSMCVRFASLYDVTRNIFRDSGQKFLTYNVDAEAGAEEATAFLTLGESLGHSPKAVTQAYKAAQKAEQTKWRERVKRQDKHAGEKGIRILLVGHSYVLEDPYIGKPLFNVLRSMDVIPLRADITRREQSLKRSGELSPTCKWETSRELLGGIVQRREDADGIILVSAFPCGPDAMVNDILLRSMGKIPVLSLVLDDQDGTAGLETRLESFIDIIRFKEGTL